MIRFILPALLFSSILALPSHAQRNRCGTSRRAPIPAGASISPADCGYWTNAPQPEYEPGAGCIFDIPVVFHVIQNNGGVGYLSPATIQDQIDILNEDFGAIAGTAGAQGTNGKIRFHLATTDPSGAATTGITYSNNNTWFQDNGTYWNTLAWDTNRYMNIYTNAVPCCYGYVEGFASEGNLVGQARDRIVLWWEAVGRFPTSGWPGNMGRTATHEVGHYVGLYHTFDSGCGSASNCYGGNGDLICDTNPQATATTGCPGSASSCGSTDPYHNYMDYTDDACIWEFTPEQMNRGRCTLINWRPNVYTEDCSGGGPGTNYCLAVPNSSGQPAAISATGSASVASNDLRLHASNASANQLGLFYFGDGQTLSPFGDGFRCVSGAVNRLGPPQMSDGLGSVERPLDNTLAPLNPTVVPGLTLNFQYWFRDPAAVGGTGFNLSDALSLTFTP
jgi:Pregnancy-associated plasma protein-A